MKYHYQVGVIVPFIKQHYKQLVAIITAVFLVSVVLMSSLARAVANNITVTPSSGYFGVGGNNIIGINGDSAPDFGNGSFKSNGLAKTDMYFPPSVLFGKEIKLGEIKNFSYWTKTGSLHSVDPRDWYVTIYTKPYAGDLSSAAWYGDRIGTEPYFSINLNDPANTWNKWSTDGAMNQLRFFESTAGAPGANFGSYTDPDWTAFVGSNALSGLPRENQDVLFLSIQTASGWASGFEGQLDGLRIELDDGTVANVNFELVEPDVTAPDMPVHLSPADNSFKTTANQLLIDWSDITDDSMPVTYEYQSANNPTTNGTDGAFVTPAYGPVSVANSEIPTPGTPEGVWYWQVRAVDAVGNKSNWTTPWKITVDNTAPVAPVVTEMRDSGNTIIPENGFTNSYSVTTYWNGVSDAAYYEYYYWNEITGNPYKVGSEYIASPVYSTSLSGVFNQGEGKHLVAVRAVDAAGNKSVLSNSYRVTYDATAPVVDVTNPLDGAVMSGTFNVTGTVTDDNNATQLLQIKDFGGNVVAGGTLSDTQTSSSAALSLPFVSTTVNDGTYSAVLVGTDAAGNSATDVVTFTLDNYVSNKEECKNGGWTRGLFGGRQFRNQGDCVSHFASSTQMLYNPDALKSGNKLRVR